MDFGGTYAFASLWERTQETTVDYSFPVNPQYLRSVIFQAFEDIYGKKNWYSVVNAESGLTLLDIYKEFVKAISPLEESLFETEMLVLLNEHFPKILSSLISPNSTNQKQVNLENRLYTVFDQLRQNYCLSSGVTLEP